jgi:hypothetical protein
MEGALSESLADRGWAVRQFGRHPAQVTARSVGVRGGRRKLWITDPSPHSFEHMYDRPEWTIFRVFDLVSA